MTMAEKQGADGASRPSSAPRVIAPTNKVNVALPFSKNTVEEPGKEFAELAAIVAALAAAMERVVTEPDMTLLRERADVLAAQSR
jgi:hypothetical protein